MGVRVPSPAQNNPATAGSGQGAGPIGFVMLSTYADVVRARVRRLAATLRRLISRPGPTLETDDTLFEGEVSQGSRWGQIEPLGPFAAEEVPEPGSTTRVSVNYLIQALNPLDGRISH